MSGWRISAPMLDDEERAKAASAGGLSDGADPGDNARGMLLGLQRQPTMYGGTVDAGVVARRRKRNKTARRSRRINRNRS